MAVLGCTHLLLIAGPNLGLELLHALQRLLLGHVALLPLSFSSDLLATLLLARLNSSGRRDHGGRETAVLLQLLRGHEHILLGGVRLLGLLRRGELVDLLLDLGVRVCSLAVSRTS